MQSKHYDSVLLLAAHARVAVSTARKAIERGAESIAVRRAREDLIDAAADLGIELGRGDTRSSIVPR